MAWVYIVPEDSGGHYIGAMDNLYRRLAGHQIGRAHTTKRLGRNVTLIGSKQFNSMNEALKFERALKAKKNPPAGYALFERMFRTLVEQPRKFSRFRPEWLGWNT